MSSPSAPAAVKLPLRRRVGIIGGMGPEATVELMARTIRAVTARDDADHIPLMVDQNPQIPSRINRLIEGHGEDPGPIIAAMARGLEDAGAEAVAMPCNTAHHYGDVIRDAVSVPFLDMIQASVRALQPGSVALLASPAVRKVGVFDAALKGRVVIHPDGDVALALIRKIKREGVTPENQAAFVELCAATGGDQTLVACTEFSLAASALHQTGTTVIDTLDVLVSEIVAFSTSS